LNPQANAPYTMYMQNLCERIWVCIQQSWSQKLIFSFECRPRLQVEIGVHQSKKDDLWVFATRNPCAVCKGTPSGCIALLHSIRFSRARGVNKWEQFFSIDIPYLQTQHGPSALWAVYIFAHDHKALHPGSLEISGTLHKLHPVFQGKGRQQMRTMLFDWYSLPTDSTWPQCPLVSIYIRPWSQGSTPRELGDFWNELQWRWIWGSIDDDNIDDGKRTRVSGPRFRDLDGQTTQLIKRICLTICSQ
jgi:hypothetical protein